MWEGQVEGEVRDGVEELSCCFVEQCEAFERRKERRSQAAKEQQEE